MRAFFVLAVLSIAACSSPPTGNETVADINAAAARAQADVDRYAANSAAAPAPAPLKPAEPGRPGGLADDRMPLSEAPFAPDNAQGAADVVQTYYALIGEARYREARDLWGDKGAESGQSADAFAARFAKYSEYHATVGAPGDIDAGAGQRYVTVPVQAYARLNNGAAAYWTGSVVLHRTADVDGATPEDKAWRIKSVDLKPAPLPAGR